MTSNSVTDEMLPSASQPASEITQDEAVQNLNTDEDPSDLTLRGSDGSEVTVSRSFLSIRNTVFCLMLSGPFAEASKPVVKIGYDGAVLKAIVEYIYFDQIPALLSNDEAVWDIYIMPFLGSLVEAAGFFDLPELRRKIYMLARAQIKKNHDFATLFLAVSGPGSVAMALALAKRNLKVLIDGKRSLLELVRSSYIEDIVRDSDLFLNETPSFLLLKAWADAKDGRRRTASQMTRHIHLEDIDPTVLSTTVASSGLVTPEQLDEALETQVGRPRIVRRWRGRNFVWRSSNRFIFQAVGGRRATSVDCPILTSGVCKWSIQVLFGDQGLTLGVGSTRFPTHLARSPPWALANGYAFHAGKITKRYLPRFKKRSTVSFTLDLEGEGVLTASIDGKAPFELFSGMLQGHGENDGFFPYIYGSRIGVRAKFLGFERMSST